MEAFQSRFKVLPGSLGPLNILSFPGIGKGKHRTIKGYFAPGSLWKHDHKHPFMLQWKPSPNCSDNPLLLPTLTLCTNTYNNVRIILSLTQPYILST